VKHVHSDEYSLQKKRVRFSDQHQSDEYSATEEDEDDEEEDDEESN